MKVERKHNGLRDCPSKNAEAVKWSVSVTKPKRPEIDPTAEGEMLQDPEDLQAFEKPTIAFFICT